LIFIKRKKPKFEKKFSSVSVIIPSHNEERYIQECIESVIAADFKGKKEIIVVDDGSKDKTAEIASKYLDNIKLIRKKHSGKSDSINKAISVSKGELIAIVDGDSFIQKDALQKISAEVERKNVVAASCIVKVKNRKKHILMWVHIEQIYNSLMRYIFSKINANIVTPGPLGIYRRKELLEVGGFSKKGFSEDIDVTIRLIRKGYKIGFAKNAVSETNMPYKAKEFLRQRTRFVRGIIDIFKKHLSINKTIIDLYTLPLFLFNYVQAVIMGSFTLYQIFSGYFQYFVSKGVYFSFPVVKFFFEWFSIVGFVRWAIQAFSGQIPLTFVTIVGIASTLLSYPLYLYAIIRFDKKFDFWHIFALFFMFPFWLIIMVIYILCLPEYFRKNQLNIWKKNE
jgi:cellulose synthase/poly-beta-1,6-N-acetylglucosamine synthase-like glycosyltransferase